MLSQAIVKTALLVTRSTDAAQRSRFIEELRQLDSLWERSHPALKEGDPILGVPGKNSPEIRQMFNALDAHYTNMAAATHALLEKASDAAADTSGEGNAILVLEGPYLKAMNDIVFQYDREATIRDDSKNRLHLAVLLTVLG